jgi:hypothetical protein
MRNLGDLLAEFDFPQVQGGAEDDISPLKARDIVVDGYEVAIYYSKSILSDDRAVECLQCLGQRSPFLPFHVVVKIAKEFLGDKYLGFVDVFINNKKVYCWIVHTDGNGKPVDNDHFVVREIEFEGTRIGYLDPEVVRFF